MRMEKWKISVLALAVIAGELSAGIATAARGDRTDGHVFLGVPAREARQHRAATQQFNRVERRDNTWRNRWFDRDRDLVRNRERFYRDLARERDSDRERERRRIRNGALLGLGLGFGLGALTYPYYSGYHYPRYSTGYYSSGYYDPGNWVTSYNGPDGTNCFNSYYGYYGYIYNGYCYQYPPPGFVPY